MAKITAAATPATEKAPAKKSPKPAAKAEPKAEKKVTKKAAKADVVVEAKPKAEKKSVADKPKASGKTKKAAVNLTPEQLEEHIRVAAYFLWEEHGRNEGAHEEHWQEAEKKIRK